MAEIPDDPSQAAKLLQELKENFRGGETKSAEFRKQMLSNLIAGIQEMKDELADAHYKDLGINKFMYEFLSHGITVTEIEHLKANLKSWMKPSSVETPLALGISSCETQYQPLGVVLVISAWNYPIYTSLPQVAAAIAAGNCVLLKPSQIASYTSNALKKLFDKYLDERYCKCLEGKVEVAKAVSKLPFDKICFTGSTMTGRLVAIEAAKNLTPCLLELGGKCPVIIDESANIESAVNRILFGRFANCGQTCVAADHIYAHESIYQRFKQCLLQKLRIGYGNHENCEDGHYGRIINQLRFNRLCQLLNDKHNGTVLFGGKTDQSKLYIAPTVIENPSKNSLMMSEQIFGPILPLFTYKNVEEVIEEVMSREKPLVVYTFSENSKNINKLRQDTSSGSFVVNDAVVHLANHHLPFGGVGGSGYGRYHGFSGFINFSNEKSIAKIKSGDFYPLTCRYPPYTEDKKKLMLKLFKFGSLTYNTLGKIILVIFVLIALAIAIPCLVMS